MGSIMDKDLILKLIDYCEFSARSNYVEYCFYEYSKDKHQDDEANLEERIEQLKKYLNN